MNLPSVTHSGPLSNHDAVVAMCTVNLFRMGFSESLPPPYWNRVTIFEGAGVVDERCPGNNERGLPVEWYGSLKNLSKNILKRGQILRQKLFLREGYVTYSPPPPPPSKTNRAPWYVSRKGGWFLNPVHTKS